MHRILRRLPVKMVFETDGPSIAPKHSMTLSCRSKAHLASKLNATEQRSYEVRFNMCLNQFR